MPKVIRKNTDLSAGHGCFPPTVPNQGSDNVFANSKEVVRAASHKDDYVTHTCGSDTHASGPDREASEGSPDVFANNSKVHRNGDDISCGDKAANGSDNVFANEVGGTEEVAGTIIPIDPYSPEAVGKLEAGPGPIAVIDDGDHVPEPITEDEKEKDEERPPDQPPPVTSCAGIPLSTDPTFYDTQISTNFKLRQLSINAKWPHKIVAQRGLTPEDIACNLKALAENVLDAIWSQYPNFQVNSGFRRQQNGRSQHETGQAADIQWPGLSFDGYWERAQRIKDTINYDQFLYEYGNTVWIHVSFNRAGNRSKSASNAVMTMFKGNYIPGLRRYR